MRRPSASGGWHAIRYTLKKAREAGGTWKLYRALRTKNACKTCALGMGGQKGGMVNERGSFPEVCKKSIQAMVSDMQVAITADFWSRFSIEQMKRWTPRQLEVSGRLIQPVLYEAGASHYRTITWSEAFQRIVDKLKKTHPDETFWYFSGRSSNEAGFLLQLLARLYGTNNVNNCSYYCHQASGVGLGMTLGTGTATVTLDDLEMSDCVFVIGGNPPSNHPRLMTTLMHLRRRRGKVIVINPVKELGLVRFRIPSDPWSLFFGSSIATSYVQPHIGGDLGLLTGVAKAVVELGGHDAAFLREHCRNANEYLRQLGQTPWETIEQTSGVSKQEIFDIAQTYIRSKNVVFSWTMGITHHAHGVQNVQAIVNLALLRGMVGRPGAGLMPIRGHSNVQGIGSVGVTPKLRDEILQNLRDKFQLDLPTQPGLDTLACTEAAHDGKMRVGFCLGGNLFGSNPDATYADQALSNLDQLVMMNTTLNTGHVHGLAKETIILPVLARDEEPELTTQESMFNFVRISDGGPRRVPGPRSEVQVIAELGRHLLGPQSGVDWSDMERTHSIRKWIAQVVPGYAQVSEIEKDKKEFQIPGRTFHKPEFKTPDGKAVLTQHELPPLQGTGDGELRLMTVRSEGQFNTVVYEDEDVYRGQDRRDVILMHPDDVERLGLKEDQPVTVKNDVGAMHRILVRAYPDIRAGNALMYYPEANVLVPRKVDPQSKTPIFKGVVVNVLPE
ncbi:MAG: FdhF/YdeP family oxidoreductase [Pirellulales bacterium]